MSRPADRRKQQEWLQHLLRWRRSRLSVRDYCAVHHLSEARFYSWKRTLQRRGLLPATTPAAERPPRRAQPPLFLPLVVPAVDATTGRIELVAPAGWIVRLAAGFDAQTLRQLLAVLREQPC